ncbi:MAG: ribosome small subunit-dependent GTPase A [Candidatus Nomurabacteria bacterium]|nr:ribosome small subunit-dependent GTPase A [Candidatus Nomurabacteria bacterium]
MQKEIKIEDLGYDTFFESNRKKLKLDEFSIARVTVEHRGAYKVKNTNGEFLAKITGKQMFDATSREDYPAVGDWVAITELNREQAVIHKVLPRKTIIKRRSNNKNEIQVIATNIDVAFIVESVDRDYNLNRFERYFAIANDGGIKPAIILNKMDLISKEDLDLKLAEIKNRFNDVDIILASTITDEGLNELKNYIIKRKTYCFLGSSGVGKSSLINKLFGKDIIKTENISISTNRGKHTTTNREIYFLENGGIVIDNPGMRGVGMTDTNMGIDNLFDEITTLARECKFIDCTHIHEPGCGVLSALKSGELNKDKYSNYINLKKEAEFYNMSEMERNEKDYKFGKFIKKAKKQLKELG